MKWLYFSKTQVMIKRLELDIKNTKFLVAGFWSLVAKSEGF